MTDVTLEQRKKVYDQTKAKHPDATVLFRNGDFYQVYSEDAVKVAKVLGLKTEDVEHLDKNCSFPYYAIDTYLPKLIKAGLRIAIVDGDEFKEATKKEAAKDEHKDATNEYDVDGVNIDNAFANMSDAASKLLDDVTYTLDLLHKEYERTRNEYDKKGASYTTNTAMANATKWLAVVAKVQYEIDKCLGDINDYWC